MAYKGKYERTIDHKIAEQAPKICINWINIGPKEAASGGADRITAKLLKSGYRSDGTGVHPDFRAAYEAGEKVNGKREVYQDAAGNLEESGVRHDERRK